MDAKDKGRVHIGLNHERPILELQSFIIFQTDSSTHACLFFNSDLMKTRKVVKAYLFPSLGESNHNR